MSIYERPSLIHFYKKKKMNKLRADAHFVYFKECLLQLKANEGWTRVKKPKTVKDLIMHFNQMPDNVYLEHRGMDAIGNKKYVQTSYIRILEPEEK